MTKPLEFTPGVMMACGCAAQGTIDGVVGCGVHLCTERATTQPDLTGRTALCLHGGSETPSYPALAFFEHRPNEKHDRYYCGCFGWD
jgi:hypothetical protein